MKTGPKPKTLLERIAVFNSVNKDRKASLVRGEVQIRHLPCGTKWIVSNALTVRKQSVIDYAAARPNKSLSCRFRYGLGCPCCETDDSSRLESLRETNRRKYGVDNPAQAESVKRKIRRTNRLRYGVSSPLASKDLRRKGYRRMEKEFDLTEGSVHNTMDVPKHRDSASAWKEDPERMQHFVDSVKATSLKRYGVTSTWKLDSVKRKIRRTMKNRYGVTHNAYLPNAAFRTMRKTEGVDSDGNKIIVQGYEQKAIDVISGCPSCHRVTKADCFVRYVHNNRLRRYYPDLEVEGEQNNYLVEVKSAYTLLSDWDRNLDKFRAARKFCQKNGLEFSVVIFNNSGSKVDVVHRPTKKRLSTSLERLSS